MKKGSERRVQENKDFMKWESEYDISFKQSEFEKRKAAYLEAAAMIKKHNKNNQNFKLAHN